MWEWIQSIWENELVKRIFVDLIVMGLVAGYLNFRFNKKIEQFKFENTKNLQIDGFFKSINEKEIKEAMEEWSDIFIDIKNFGTNFTSDKIDRMLKAVFLYGSPKTLRIASVFQQFNYITMHEKKLNNENTYALLYLLAETVCCLKYDFTGSEVDTIDFLKLKLNDAYKKDKNNSLKKARKLARKLIKYGVDQRSGGSISSEE